MYDPTDEEILLITRFFRLPAPVCTVMPWGNGLINRTYRLHTADGGVFLMQQINTTVYQNIHGIMENIYMVTEALRQEVYTFRDGRQKPSMCVIPLKDGRLYYTDDHGSAWRIYNFIRKAYCVESVGTTDQTRKIAFILGRFHHVLKDFPVENLHMVEQDFHNPMRHYADLCEACRRNLRGHLADVTPELLAIEDHRALFDTFNRPEWADRLPLRVNHNDPKINNIMMDIDSHESICLVDFDTVMPGILAYDFGDSVRSVMCTGRDNGPDTDIASIHFNREYYHIYKEEFLKGARGMLTPAELESLDIGVRLILWESAMRYLADYLNGNIYLKVRYPEQNLVKARIHIQVARELDVIDLR